MSTFIKPCVYNPCTAERRIEALEVENAALKAEIERILKERTNLEIKCRILEEERIRGE